MRLDLRLAVFCALALAVGCGGSGGGSEGSGSFTTKCGAPDAGKGNIIGQVRDAWGAVLSGQDAVTFGAQKGDVDGYGRFYLCNVVAGQESIVTVNVPRVYQWGTYNGNAPVSKRVTLADGEERLVNFRLKYSAFTAVDAATVAAGAMVSDGATSVTFPADAFVKADGSAFVGAVNVQISTFDSSNPDDLESFPGDFAGVDGQAEVGLYSLGFVNVQLFDDDENPLQLAEGKNAKLVFPVKNLEPGDTVIPMWYFDEAAGTWIREGEGTIDQSTGTIVAYVAHFSYWNADKPVTLTDCVTGLAQDSEGKPLPGAIVYGSGQGTGKADATGSFCVNFYPKASFELRGNFFDAGMVYDAITPYQSHTGTREGGQSCASPSACTVLASPVVFEGNETVTRCLRVTLANATANHKAGTLTIGNVTGGTIYSNKMNGATSACVELPVGYEISANLSAFGQGIEAFCSASAFNGVDLAEGAWSVVIGQTAATCSAGSCDELVMTCEEFSGHP